MGERVAEVADPANRNRRLMNAIVRTENELVGASQIRDGAKQAAAKWWPKRLGAHLKDLWDTKGAPEESVDIEVLDERVSSAAKRLSHLVFAFGRKDELVRSALADGYHVSADSSSLDAVVKTVLFSRSRLGLPVPTVDEKARQLQPILFVEFRKLEVRSWNHNLDRFPDVGHSYDPSDIAYSSDVVLSDAEPPIVSLDSPYDASDVVEMRKEVAPVQQRPWPDLM